MGIRFLAITQQFFAKSGWKFLWWLKRLLFIDWLWEIMWRQRVWDFKTRPKSWPNRWTLKVNRYHENIFSKFSSLNPPPLTARPYFKLNKIRLIVHGIWRYQDITSSHGIISFFMISVTWYYLQHDKRFISVVVNDDRIVSRFN